MDDPVPHLRAKSRTSRSPHGESLAHHSLATLRAARAIARRIGTLPGLPEPYATRFWLLVAWAALVHDAGKIATGFQQMLSGLVPRWPERHEVVSLGFLPHLLPPDDLVPVAVAVACHHRALTGDTAGGKPSLATQYRGMSNNDFATQIGAVSDADATDLAAWYAATAAGHELPTMAGTPIAVGGNDIIATAHGVLRGLFDDWETVDPGLGRAAVLLQGAVTFADHLSSAGGYLHTRQPLDHRYPTALATRLKEEGAGLYAHQQAAAACDGHMLLRAPTGAGKTDASLLWAVGQIQAIAAACGGVPRLYYTLPYLASINAMVDRLATLLDELGEHGREVVGVCHSRAASYYLAASLGDDEQHGTAGPSPATVHAAVKAVARDHATRLFRETVRVGTPYQLMRAALAGPTHSSVLLDAANSVFILDELHAYDPKRLGFLLASARFWAQLGGRVCVLSATIPDRLAGLLHATLGHLHEVSPQQPAPARHRIHTHADPLNDPASHAMIADRLRAGQSVLVVANTVAQAQSLYAALAPLARELHGHDAAWLLHSRYRRVDRSRIETAIHTRWGAGRPRRPGLLVGTQAIEVSLDIDFDTAHISAATLEAMLQRFGRVNRLGMRPLADVTIHAPTYRTRHNDQSGQLYADGIYPQYPVVAAWDLLTVHNGQELNDGTATSWLNDIYTSPWGDDWAQQVAEHQATFTTAFLTFTRPMHDRSHLADLFDTLFDGTDVILADDRDNYAKLLASAPTPAPGRLLADDLLIPLPWYTRAAYDKDLRVRIIDGDYSPENGLTALRGPHRDSYRPGQIL